MFVNDPITSRHNPRIKQLLKLQKHQERAQEGLFLIEGIKEIEKAIAAKYLIQNAFYCPQIISKQELKSLIGMQTGMALFEVSPDVFKKIAYRENSGGVVLVAKSKMHLSTELVSSKNPLYLVLEGVEKPGNLGAIYRTADAAGVDAILIADKKTDLYNPNTIRASLGCVFTVPTVIGTNAELLKMLNTNHIQILSTYLEASVPYHTVDFKIPSAIVMGTEATGITRDWINASAANIIIPMKGMADSMNVSVSTAIVVFEAMRQRGFK